MKKFNFFNWDLVSELKWDSILSGVWIGWLVSDLGQGRYVTAALDAVILLWMLHNVKSTSAKVRAQNETGTN